MIAIKRMISVFGLLIYLHACGPDTKNDESGPRVGDVVFLVAPSGKSIGCAASSESHSALRKASSANDDYGIQELVDAGQVVAVQSGTSALLVDLEVFGPKIVRILEGPYAGNKVWVSDSYVRKSLPKPIKGVMPPYIPVEMLGASDSMRLKTTIALQRLWKACPGLTVSAEDVRVLGLEEGRSKWTLTVQIADHPISIPRDYYASGHRCYYEIMNNGDHVAIAKRPCASVCADRIVTKEEVPGNEFIIRSNNGSL